MRLYTPLHNVEGITSPGTVTIGVPRGRRYHNINVNASVTNIDAADPAEPSVDPRDIFDTVKIIVSGVAVWEAPVAFILDEIRTLTGENIVDYLPLFFSQHWMRTVIGEEATSWDLFGNQQTYVELSVKSGLSGLQINAAASYDLQRNLDPTGRPFLAIMHKKVDSFTIHNGENDITILSQDSPLHAMHFDLQSGTLDRLVIERNGQEIINATTADYAKELLRFGVVSTFTRSVVFGREKQLTSPLEFTAGGTFRVSPTIAGVQVNETRLRIMRVMERKAYF